jgi:hypothetical protein
MPGERIDYGIERQRHEGFVGRETLMDRLDALLTADGADRWVVVTGGPGMGKSAHRSRRRAGRQSAAALPAACRAVGDHAAVRDASEVSASELDRGAEPRSAPGTPSLAPAYSHTVPTLPSRPSQ